MLALAKPDAMITHPYLLPWSLISQTPLSIFLECGLEFCYFSHFSPLICLPPCNASVILDVAWVTSAFYGGLVVMLAAVILNKS